jgi:putative transposase
MRKEPLISGEYYHIYNRGVDKRDIFKDEDDYLRFIKSVIYFNSEKPIGSIYENDYKQDTEKTLAKKFEKSNQELESQLGVQLLNERSKPLVEFVCYCLNPNHFHFILKQISDKGISEFMKKVGTGYANYFNNKYTRSGALFQGKFKSIRVGSNDDLLWLAAYVNGNAQIHGLVADASKYPWCSYPEYLGLTQKNICDKDMILGQFKNVVEFKKVIDERLVLIKEKKDIQDYLLD